MNTTPGPWMTDSLQGLIYSRPHPLKKFVIAQMESGSDEDMSLMAAAPEMRDALVAFLANYAGMEDGDGNEAPELEMARVALAKAEPHMHQTVQASQQ